MTAKEAEVGGSGGGGGVNLNEPRKQHSRGSSASSTLTSGTVDSDRGAGANLPPELADHTQVSQREMTDSET